MIQSSFKFKQPIHTWWICQLIHLQCPFSVLNDLKKYNTIWIQHYIPFWQWVFLVKTMSCVMSRACKIILLVATITGILWPFYSFWTTHLGFPCSGSATTHIPWCFCPWTFSLNIDGLNMLPSDSFLLCLDSLLRYSKGEFQVLQLIVLVAFGTGDFFPLPPVC